jgi:hypothetical protein
VYIARIAKGLIDFLLQHPSQYKISTRNCCARRKEGTKKESEKRLGF